MAASASAAAADSQPHAKNELGFGDFRQQFTTVKGLTLCSYTNIQSDSGLAAFDKKTILLLLHGYPQSPYEWRYVAPILASKGYPLFIPDLVGYANSPDEKQTHPQDKLSVGLTLLTSLSQHLSALKTPPAQNPTDIILITHDRGSRIGHRLSVSRQQVAKDLGFNIKAVALMDIVPTLEQYAGFANSAIAKGYFHWPFLANVPIAVSLITSLGGSRWVTDMVNKMTKFDSTKEALSVYASQYDSPTIVESTCRDYEAAVLIDVPAQKEDQAASPQRQLDIPMIVFWSETGLGSWFDVPVLWKKWTKQGTDMQFEPVGDGAGHYLPEDNPKFVSGKLVEWLAKVDQ